MKNAKPLTDTLKQYLVPAFERKAKSITAIDVHSLTSYTDTLIIIEANSHRQVTAIAEHLVKRLKDQKKKSIGVEGVKEGEWALLDYGEVIIHIFEPEKKQLYDIEGLWADARRFNLAEFKNKNQQLEKEDDV